MFGVGALGVGGARRGAGAAWGRMGGMAGDALGIVRGGSRVGGNGGWVWGNFWVGRRGRRGVAAATESSAVSVRSVRSMPSGGGTWSMGAGSWGQFLGGFAAGGVNRMFFSGWSAFGDG